MDNDFNYHAMDPRASIDIYRHHLPHWRQPGVIYFATLRLTDSIPRLILEQWQRDRKQWLSAHGLTDSMPPEEFRSRYERIPVGVRRAFERDHARRMHVELDKCHGACPLRNPEAADILAQAMHFHHNTRLHCGDFVIMPNHAHWLLVPYPDNDLEDLLGSVKRYSAGRINKLIGRHGTLWQGESFDHIVRNENQLQWFRDYIRNNGVTATLSPDHYDYYMCNWLK